MSQETTNDPQSIPITDDSIILKIPVHNITQTDKNDPTSNDTTHNPHEDTTSILFTSNTLTTQELQPLQTIQPKYDPALYSPLTTSHNSPQQGSSKTQVTNTVQFQTITPSTQPEVQTLAYTPAQTTQTKNIQPAITHNTLQSNPLTNYTTSRHLSIPPSQTIPTNPLSYSLTSTIPKNTQTTITNNNLLDTLNPRSTSQQPNILRNILHNTQIQLLNPPSTTTRTNPYINPTYSQPVTNPPNIPFTVSNIPIYNTHPPSTMSQPTIPQPTYFNSSTSIYEPIKPFDGLDHNYTPEEYLQHIEARVTFSLGSQPTSDHEYKFWHARRMAFVQGSLTGTAHSWYTRLNDTYKQDWHAFVQAFKKQFSSQKNAYYAQVETLNLTKKITKQYAILQLKINS